MNNFLSKTLTKLLNEAGLSQNELARRTGVPQQVIQRLVVGAQKNPTIETLIPLADYFMISLDQLLGKTLLPETIATNPKHQGWRAVPLYDYHTLLESYTKKNMAMSAKKQVPCDVRVSDQAFALVMPDNAMEPRFTKDTISIFDPVLKPKHKNFILIYDSKAKQLAIRQIIIKDNISSLRCLNPKFECFKPYPIRADQKIIGILVQAQEKLI